MSLLAACTCLVVLFLMMCGVAEAADYDSIDITSANCVEWSTNLSNNVSVISNNINVISGTLHLSSATILMGNEGSINVRNGATMNVASGSMITHNSSGNYHYTYYDGSYGNLSDSTIEHSYELEIATTNSITITGCTISNNLNHGIHLNSTSGYVNITDCTISNTVQQHGIFIESSQGNILRNNNLNNNNGNYSLYVTGNYDQDIDTSNNVNGGRVYYNFNDSGTITDLDIGHVTIVDCSDLLFTNCKIHNGDGVRIRGVSSNVIIRVSTIENNTIHGINFESTSWNNITSVLIKNNAKHGVYFVDSSNNLINDSHILDNTGDGIHSGGTSSRNRISSNSIINNVKGLFLTGNGHNNFTDNNISGNRNNGIVLGISGDNSSEYNIFHNNTIRFNDISGITFGTNYNTLTNNTISENLYLAFEILDYYYNYIWRSNTANGEEINYYYNENGNTVQSKSLTAYNVSNVGKITLVNCNNFNIHDNNLLNNINSDSGGYGIFLRNSGNNDFADITLSNNYDGIKLYRSSNNNFTHLQTINPSNQHGASLLDSDYNSITDSSLTATNLNGLKISSSDHTTLSNIMISSVNQSGLDTDNAHYTYITNATIVSTEADGAYMTSSDHVTIRESRITANNTGIYFNGSNNTDLINNTIGGKDGICMSESHLGNLTKNNIDATLRGIFLTTSRDFKLTVNNITKYTITGILLEEYSTNNTMIGNDFTRNGSKFDIRINDSDDAIIAPNNTVTANYTFYLTKDTRLCTLDTVFNKTMVGCEDTSNLTLMWRIDVLCWDNYHKEPMWTNLTVRYRDISDYDESLCWEGETPNANGRLSNNAFDDYGPPTASSNWLPVIEYKQNTSKKTNYQPMNCTAVNRWDVLNKIYDQSYKNITTVISGPGITILVEAGHTPNGKCYYCHVEKLMNTDGTYKFPNTIHWTKYNERIMNASMDDPYTPGRCIDCHDKNDSENIPHGNTSGKDLLYQPSPQLCYNGKGNQTCHNSSAIRVELNQKEQFSNTTHHQLEDGKLACKACHDNHGSKHQFDLLRYYTNVNRSTYDSANFALCFVCHLEEKIVAKMSGETGHLANYMNQTNFRDEYNSGKGFGGGFQNVHSPQEESLDTHLKFNCYACHNPHGAVNPAMTRSDLNYTYITNLTPPGDKYPDGDWENQTILGQANWSDPTLNQGGGLWPLPGVGDWTRCVTWCHSNGYDTTNNLPDYFSYREFIEYETAGGAGCLECHDNNAFAYNEIPIRQIVNLTAVKRAMHSNLSGAFRSGSKLQGTNRTFTEWLEYREYTAAQINNITEDNAICWACHCTNGTPPSPNFHPDRALNPYKCPKCHGPYDGQPPHTQGLVAAIDNHGPTTKGIGSMFIQTDVGSNGSCQDCHAPSRLSDDDIGDLTVWKWGYGKYGHAGKYPNPAKNWIPYTGTTTMGNVSHYGLNRSQGEAFNIANPLLDTSDCLFCHCNTTNGQIWGNAPNVTDNMYGTNTSNLSECYTYCHVLPNYLDVITEDNIPHFHDKSLYAGGGFDCVVCHDINSSFGVHSLVDADAIAAGIHRNVTNNTYTDILECDPRSKPCWGCHNSNGMQPEGMGDRNYIYQPQKKPWSCEDCHTRSDEWNAATSYGETWISSSYPKNRLPPIIYAHYPNSTTLKTNMIGEGTCMDCHNNSINHDHVDTQGKLLCNTLASNISHYGTTTDLIYPTEDCSICHNTTPDIATKWGGARQNRHGNFTDESNQTDGCYVCHTNDNETPVDLHAANLWSGTGGPECLECHDNDGFAVRKRINESVYEDAVHGRMNNATTGPYGTNQSCWVCHFENGTNVDEHSMRKDVPYLCDDCHNKVGGPFGNVSDAPNVYNHFRNGTNISAYWTLPTDLDSCIICHNQSEMKYLFTENDNYRTTLSVLSHYGDNGNDIAVLYNEITYSNDYCRYCHNNDSTPFVEWNNMKKIEHYPNQTCAECHGEGRFHNETLTRALTDGNCTDCHATYGSHQEGLKYRINVTAVNSGVHANVNHNMSDDAETRTKDRNNSKCWGCHVPNGTWPEDGHRDTFNNDAYLCYDCHNGTYAYENVNTATAVYNHFKSGINIKANTNATTNSESCGYGCHNLTSMKVPNFDNFAGSGQAEYRLNLSQSSHYPQNRTDIIINDNLSDCIWCHRDPTNEFIDIFDYAGEPNFTENIPHGTKTSGCIVVECHNTGRIHDSSLKIPTLSWSEECGGCHFGLNDTDAYVNETMFNASVHGAMKCIDCHINETFNKSLVHPVEDYTWKWCECCHSYQTDLVNEKDRHNVTNTPSTYSVGGTNVLDITDCTTCHNATAYNATVDYYNTNEDTNECRYCHVYPDKGNRTSQEWY